MSIIKKPYIFITGAPRSGTSMLTKIVDSHPDVGVFMENIFGLRRRHWQFPGYWYDDNALFTVVNDVFKKLNEPVVGNKVCTPDVWDTDEIIKMCNLFLSSKILFLVRDPVSVVSSRGRRDGVDEYSDVAKKYLCLDWSCKSFTSVSSWRQSVEVYWKLKENMRDDVLLVYYDDLVNDFEGGVKEIFEFLGLPMSDSIYSWHKLSHYDQHGNKLKNLKYKDKPVIAKVSDAHVSKDVTEYLKKLIHYQLWVQRRL